jgi:hypothetical protein
LYIERAADRLSGLALAKYVMQRITIYGDTLEKLSQDMDCDEEYSFTIVSFLRDIEWIEQEPSGKYVITDKGISQG